MWKGFEEQNDVFLASFFSCNSNAQQSLNAGAAAAAAAGDALSSRAVARCLILVPRLCPARLSDGCSRAPVRRRAPATTWHLSSAVRALPDRFVAAQSPARRCERCFRLGPQTEAGVRGSNRIRATLSINAAAASSGGGAGGNPSKCWLHARLRPSDAVARRWSGCPHRSFCVLSHSACERGAPAGINVVITRRSKIYTTSAARR